MPQIHLYENDDNIDGNNEICEYGFSFLFVALSLSFSTKMNGVNILIIYIVRLQLSTKIYYDNRPR